MAPECKIINFTENSLDWLGEMILGEENFSKNKSEEYKWDIVTKYYKAEVMLKMIKLEEFWKNTELFDDTEAVVFICDTLKETLDKADKVWLKIKESSPAVCLFVVEKASDETKNKSEASRTQILDWCLSNQFELVECNENDEEDDESESEEQFYEKAGKERIIQALKAHTWSNLELLEEKEAGHMCDKPLHESAEDQIKSSLLSAAEEVISELLPFIDLIPTWGLKQF